jgi:hypothetical protein
MRGSESSFLDFYSNGMSSAAKAHTGHEALVLLFVLLYDWGFDTWRIGSTIARVSEPWSLGMGARRMA